MFNSLGGSVARGQVISSWPGLEEGNQCEVLSV